MRVVGVVKGPGCPFGEGSDRLKEWRWLKMTEGSERAKSADALGR